VADEVAGPLGADFQVGALERERDRIAPLGPPPRLDPDPDVDLTSVPARTWRSPVISTRATLSTEWRAADLGALNGHSNARGVLDVMRVLSLGGGAGGVRLLSPKAIDLVFDQQSDGLGLVLEEPFRFGIGYCLGSPVVSYVPPGRTFFRGGSLVVMDLDRRLTISYVMNRTAAGILRWARSEAHVRAVHEAVG
jgi:hypothetical protein